MPYKPKYAKGQILVEFKRATSQEFARTFGKQIGFEFADEDYEHGLYAVAYKTKPGKERQAIKKFKSYPDFVKWAYLRDIKLEARWNHLEEIAEEVKAISDDASTLSDREYERRRKLIASKLKLPEKA